LKKSTGRRIITTFGKKSLYSGNTRSILRASDLVNLANILQPVGIPDHSILKWRVELNVVPNQGDSNLVHDNSFTKFDVKNVPESFMTEPVFINEVHNCVFNLEQSMRNQDDIDNSYSRLCSIIHDEMQNKLPCKRIINGPRSNKGRRIGKPWWSDDLSDLENATCEAERKWLASNSTSEKRVLKSDYVFKHKRFGRAVQRSKRKYWYNLQVKLSDEAESNSSDFWKSIGKIGVGHTKKQSIPMEVNGENGSILNDTNVVLDKWKTCFKNLYNPLDSNNGTQLYQNDESGSSDHLTGDNWHDFNSYISVEEIRKSVNSA